MIKAYNAKQWEIPLLMDGKKTVKRQIILPHNPKKAKEQGYYQGRGLWVDSSTDNRHKDGHIKDYTVSPCWQSYRWYFSRYAPYQPGDILYVRETWCNANIEGVEPDYYYYADIHICEDYDKAEWKWRPSIYMPREAARIWLKVTDVRVERLQDANNTLKYPNGKDNTIIREGFKYMCDFIAVWNSTFKKSDLDRYGWGANPWVWVIEFERCEKPEGDGN